MTFTNHGKKVRPHKDSCANWCIGYTLSVRVCACACTHEFYGSS